jgi:hypothetical protein
MIVGEGEKSAIFTQCILATLPGKRHDLTFAPLRVRIGWKD